MLVHQLTILVGTEQMLLGVEMFSNRFKSREELLCVSGGFEAPHAPLSDSCWSMGVESAIVQSPMLSLLRVRQQFLLGSTIAFEFIGH